MSEYATSRALNGAIGAHVSWARTADRSARTAPARKASRDRFETKVDPEGILSPKERAIRAEHARKAHFLEMARRSAESRRRGVARRQAGKG